MFRFSKIIFDCCNNDTYFYSNNKKYLTKTYDPKSFKQLNYYEMNNMRFQN